MRGCGTAEQTRREPCTLSGPQMASEEDPFVTLGVERSASVHEIRRAYRRLLEQHRDASGRAEIPRLMRAYEVALELAQMRDEAASYADVAHPRTGTGEDEPGEGWSHTVEHPFRRPAGGWSSDPMVTRVRRCIESRAFAEAVAVATSTRWQERMNDGAADLAHATMRLACATVWTDPEAYERLARVYIDRLDDLAGDYCASALPLMLTLDSDWAAWQSFRDCEPWLSDFLQLGMAGDRKLLRETAQQIATVVRSDPTRLFRALDAMATLSPALVAFTGHLARSIPADLGLPTFPEQDLEEIDPRRLRDLFPRARVWMPIPVLLAMAVVWPSKSIALAMCSLLLLVYRDAYHNARYRLRLRSHLFELCVQHQIPPRLIVQWAARQPWLSRARPYAELVDDVVLDTSYALARLSHLLGPK